MLQIYCKVGSYSCRNLFVRILMSVLHRCVATVTTSFLICVLSGCLSSHSQQQFAMSFLPAPLPAHVESEEASAPPPNLYLHSTPNLVQKSLPQIDWPTEVDSRIVRADQRFEAGKKLYQRGDIDG